MKKQVNSLDEEIRKLEREAASSVEIDGDDELLTFDYEGRPEFELRLEKSP